MTKLDPSYSQIPGIAKTFTSLVHPFPAIPGYTFSFYTESTIESKDALKIIKTLINIINLAPPRNQNCSLWDHGIYNLVKRLPSYSRYLFSFYLVSLILKKILFKYITHLHVWFGSALESEPLPQG